MNNISFKATYVAPATIYKKGEPVKATIVKVDKSDLKSLAKVLKRPLASNVPAYLESRQSSVLHRSVLLYKSC